MASYPNQSQTFSGAAAAAPGGTAAASPPFVPAASSMATGAPVQTSPGLAFLLGLIPGVGAIYNGQYLKGLVHAGIFGMLVTLANHEGPLMGMLTAAFYAYMPFEAYHTAKKRQLGIHVDEWSSLLPRSRYADRAPIGPIVLIVLGVLFLLDSLHVIELQEIGRFWPVLLIFIGAYLLYARMTRAAQLPPSPSADQRQAPHDQVFGGQ